MKATLDRAAGDEDHSLTVDQDRQASPLFDPEPAADGGWNDDATLWSHFYDVGVTHMGIVPLRSLCVQGTGLPVSGSSEREREPFGEKHESIGSPFCSLPGSDLETFDHPKVLSVPSDELATRQQRRGCDQGVWELDA